MKRYHITLEGRTFDVTVLSDPRAEQVQVEVDGETLTVQIESVLPEGERAAAEPTAEPAFQGAAGLAGAVAAPLPGVIKSIAVRSGQRVAAGDELLVIEAMKMDNVIRAQRRGTIGTIYVVEGRQVAHGELLLEYSD
jgi:biotin carboxyl carrier protein